MEYLFLTICCVVGFQQTFRFSQSRGCRLPVVIASNYVVAAICFAAAMLLSGSSVDGSIAWRLAFRGAANGVLYFLHILVILACYRMVGVGVAAALAGMGSLVPILASWAFWGEPISAVRWCAVVLMPVAVVLMRPGQRISPTWSYKSDVLLLLNFLIAGTVGTIHKSVAMLGAGGTQPIYQACLFLMAALGSTAYAMYRRQAMSPRDVLVGTAAGLFNAGVSQFLLMSLAALAAVVALPTLTCAQISVNVVLSWLVWKERLRARQVAGVGVTIAVVLLANVR